ncbi:hypothetical protein CORMATOL_03072 [Corynebacterium matruchotii ATCC 33806]|uniref:Uncharacterized protein n=1 Tax=Corynebacterium matruchotii ATCC 33806 TaxID=566549 RepID=C0E7T0_9CORY|nr:hypothetical protein CORMATOL_03072 [Corynebacterium matruchotii ATCC 33806]
MPNFAHNNDLLPACRAHNRGCYFSMMKEKYWKKHRGRLPTNGVE